MWSLPAVTGLGTHQEHGWNQRDFTKERMKHLPPWGATAGQGAPKKVPFKEITCPRAGQGAQGWLQRVQLLSEVKHSKGTPGCWGCTQGPGTATPCTQTLLSDLAGAQVTLPAGVSSFQPSEHPHFLQDTTKLLSCYWEEDVYLQFLTENKMMIILFGR